jgi:hypothetical protein
VKKVKTTADYNIFQKRSGRYAIQDKQKNWIRGEDKTKVLLAEGLIRIAEPKPAAQEQPEEAPAAATPEQAAQD